MDGTVPVETTSLLDGDAMMDATECFEDEKSSILHEFIGATNEKEVIVEHSCAVTQLLLGAFEIEMHVEAFEKFSDWITECVGFLDEMRDENERRLDRRREKFWNLLDDFHQFLQRSFVLLSRIDDHGSSEISK